MHTDACAGATLLTDRTTTLTLIALSLAALSGCGNEDGAAAPDGGTPGMVEVLAMNQSQVPELVVSGGALYWTHLEPQMSPQGSVRTMATGGGAVSTVTTTAMMPGGLVVTGDDLYFTQTDNPGTAGDVMKMSLTGGDPPMSVGGGGAVRAALAPSSGGVYWASFANNTFTLGDSAAPPSVFAQVISGGAGLGEFTIIVAGGAVFWTPGGVHRVPLGGQSAPIVTGLDAPVVGLAADASDIYIATGETIRRVPAAGGGGAGTILYTAPTDASPQPILAMAQDATHVYWVEVGAGMSGRVMKLAMTGGAPALVAESPTTALRLAVDDTSVYWTGNFGGVPGQTTIYRAPR